MLKRHLIPLSLAILITLIAFWSGLTPTDRAVWYAEVMPIFIIFALLVLTYRKFQFSGLAYILMSFWMILHLIGAKYTFANVPFEWGSDLLSPLLGENRNHFDRVAHYVIGFSSYEIIEWQYAVIEGGNAGVEFLGSQGDIWDAQKDMLADTLGALTALVIYLIARPDLALRDEDA